MSDLSDLMKAPGAGLEAEDDFERINSLYIEKGWGDGLPIVPPTIARVEKMLAYCDRPLDLPLGLVAPRYGEATPLRLAANAVMAGCKPEYFPLVMLAIDALIDERFNLYGVSATTHPCTTLIIVNGPVAKELKMNSGHNAFGPGNQANATIGRAVRLAMLNIGGAIPATGDMATFGTPAKYTFCAAENEDASPWEPLQVELGFARDVSTVSVFGAESMHNMNDHESITGVGILKMMAGAVATTGANNFVFRRRAGVRVRSRACRDDRARRLLESGREEISVRARARAARHVVGREHRAPHPPVAGVQRRIRGSGPRPPGARDEKPGQRVRVRDRRRGQALGVHSDFRRDPSRHAAAENARRQAREIGRRVSREVIPFICGRGRCAVIARIVTP